MCVDKQIIPTLLELLTVEEPRLNYQAVAVVGILCTYSSDTQDQFRKGAFDAIVDLLQKSPAGSAARYFVLEAIYKMIHGNSS